MNSFELSYSSLCWARQERGGENTLSFASLTLLAESELHRNHKPWVVGCPLPAEFWQPMYCTWWRKSDLTHSEKGNYKLLNENLCLVTCAKVFREIVDIGWIPNPLGRIITPTISQMPLQLVPKITAAPIRGLLSPCLATSIFQIIFLHFLCNCLMLGNFVVRNCPKNRGSDKFRISS